jgi:hypothetical protein
MRGLVALSACALTALAAPSGANAALEARLAVEPARPQAGEEAQIRLRTYTPLVRKDGSCCRLVLSDPRGYPFRVEAVSPRGVVLRVGVSRARPGLWRGVFRFARAGLWQVRVANYAPQYRRARIFVGVRSALPTPPPTRFRPLGQPGCDPPSPRNPAGQTFPARGEVFGTAVGGKLWALFFNGEWSSSASAVLAGVVGKRVKIVFRMTGSGGFEIAAMGPDGTRVNPVWGPVFHPSSTWTRPGLEWGTSFVFSQPGCWRIQAKHGDVTGDVWLLVRS